MNQTSHWQKYLDLLQRKQVPEKVRRWYVIRVEQLLKAFPKQKLSSLSVEDLTAYLGALSRNPKLDAWQFSQAVLALQYLFQHFVDSSVGADVDWVYWHDAAKALEASHASRVVELIFWLNFPKRVQRIINLLCMIC